MAKFKVGDRVEITHPHMDMKVGDQGTIAEVSDETPYAIQMDDAAMGVAAHKWYTDSEIKTASTSKSAEGQLDYGQLTLLVEKMRNDLKSLSAQWQGKEK